jgi:hypothetical protein
MERLDAIPSRLASSVATVKQAGGALLESLFRLVKLKLKQQCCAHDRLDSEEHESAVTGARACPVCWHESIVFTRALQDRNSTLSHSIPKAITAGGGAANVGHRGNRYRRSGTSRGLLEAFTVQHWTIDASSERHPRRTWMRSACSGGAAIPPFTSREEHGGVIGFQRPCVARRRRCWTFCGL